jgi:hypothetical protein
VEQAKAAIKLTTAIQFESAFSNRALAMESQNRGFSVISHREFSSATFSKSLRLKFRLLIGMQNRRNVALNPE